MSRASRFRGDGATRDHRREPVARTGRPQRWWGSSRAGLALRCVVAALCCVAAASSGTHAQEPARPASRMAVFSPDGKLLAGGGERVVREGTNRVSGSVVTLWAVESGKVKWTREPECGTVFGVSFAPDGRTLAGGGAGVVYWDTQTGKPQGLLKTEGLIDSCVFSRDGKTLAVADWKSSESAWVFRLSVWEVKTGKRIRQLKE